MTKDLVTYNLKQRVMVDNNGKVYPITKMFDDEGDETDDTQKCVVFIAGEGDHWLTVSVDPDDETVLIS